jgi:hypothetical protein
VAVGSAADLAAPSSTGTAAANRSLVRGFIYFLSSALSSSTVGAFAFNWHVASRAGARMNEGRLCISLLYKFSPDGSTSPPVLLFGHDDSARTGEERQARGRRANRPAEGTEVELEAMEHEPWDLTAEQREELKARLTAADRGELIPGPAVFACLRAE